MTGASSKRARPRPVKSRPSGASPTTDSTKVELNIDRRGLQILQAMTEKSKFPSVTATVGAALRIVRALQEQVKEGYSDVIVQNPETLEQRMLVIDFLEPLKPAQHSVPTDL